MRSGIVGGEPPPHAPTGANGCTGTGCGGGAGGAGGDRCGGDGCGGAEADAASQLRGSVAGGTSCCALFGSGSGVNSPT